MQKKTVLLVVGILIVLMGILALIPGIGMGTEPVWHAIAKLILGVAAIVIALKYENAIGTMTIVVGIVLAVMGLLALVLQLSSFSAPVWHSVVVLIVGIIVAVLGFRKK